MKGIIIGGGIAGLTTAIALRKKGIETLVFEQAPEISEVGAGVWMASNALNILHRLGLADQVLSAGFDLETVSIIDSSEKPVSRIELKNIKAKFGFGTVAIHRAVLQKILLSHIPVDSIRTGKQFVRYSQDKDSITAHFADGSSETADFLVAADGIHSNARKQLFPAQKLRYSGQTCWRVVADMQFPVSQRGKMYEIWGQSKGLRAAYSAISDQSIYSYFTVDAPAGGKDDPDRLKDHLRSLFKDFPSIIQQIIEKSETRKFLRNDLYDFEPINNWQDNRMILVGDAAHATTPNLGQGACQAVEDAYALALSLSQEKDILKAFSDFQNLRMDKAHFITNTSFALGKLSSTSGITKSIVKTIIRLSPGSLSEKQFDKIYALSY